MSRVGHKPPAHHAPKPPANKPPAKPASTPPPATGLPTDDTFDTGDAGDGGTDAPQTLQDSDIASAVTDFETYLKDNTRYVGGQKGWIEDAYKKDLQSIKDQGLTGQPLQDALDKAATTAQNRAFGASSMAKWFIDQLFDKLNSRKG